MSLPYLPLFVDDYEADTAHLSLMEDGIYSRLLRLCWRTPRCRMPNDHDWIARKIRVSSDAERAAMASVLKEFFTVRRGQIFSKRLSDEFARISVSVQRRKEAGKMGGRAKALKKKENDAGNARAFPWHPDPDPDPDKNLSVFKRAGAQKRNGWVDPKTPADAVRNIVRKIRDHDEQQGTGDGNGSDREAILRLAAGPI